MSFYATRFHNRLYNIAARRRGVSISDLVNVALFDFIFKRATPLSPKDIPILKMISRVDRKPKGNLPKTAVMTSTKTTLSPAISNSPMGEVLKEMKEKAFNPKYLQSVPENWRDLTEAELKKTVNKSADERI